MKKNKDMTQEEKELLLLDLCARLPYGVILDYSFIEGKQRIHTKRPLTYRNIGTVALDEWHSNEEIFKPYLRPLSSMTEEERKELEKITHHTFEYEKGARDIWTKSYHKYHLFGSDGKLYGEGEPINMLCSSELCIKLIDWLNMHHFDYRHLIERGLALEAPEGMYNIKEK